MKTHRQEDTGPSLGDPAPHTLHILPMSILRNAKRFLNRTWEKLYLLCQTLQERKTYTE